MSIYNINDDIEIILNSLKENNVSYQDKNVLITGGAGFIGSWICNVLIEQGANVLCIDNLFSGQMENIQHLIDHDNFEFENHDISTQYEPKQKIDVVKGRLIRDYGYDDESATDVLNFVASIFARGDVRDD